MAYSLMVEHAAHNGCSTGSSPVRPKDKNRVV